MDSSAIETADWPQISYAVRLHTRSITNLVYINILLNIYEGTSLSNCPLGTLVDINNYNVIIPGHVLRDLYVISDPPINFEIICRRLKPGLEILPK